MEKARKSDKHKSVFPFLIIVSLLMGCAVSSASHEASVPTDAAPAIMTGNPLATRSTSTSPSATPTPAPSRHPDDPILEYPVPLMGHTRPLTAEEANALRGFSGFFNTTAHIPDLGEHQIWDGTFFTPERLLGDFVPGKFYSPKEITEHLTAIEWPWSGAFKNSGGMVFFQVWEMTLPLQPDPLSLCGVGIYQVDPEDFPEGTAARDALRMEEGTIYIFQKNREQWQFMYRIADDYWHVRTQLTLAVNESNTCAWLIEEPPPGTGTGYYDSDVIWRSLVNGKIDMKYTRYCEIADYRTLADGSEISDDWSIVTVLYGLRYDWFPDGTRFIRAPDRLTMQIEKTVRQYAYRDDAHTESDDTKATGLVTAEFLCTGNRYQLISLRAEAQDEASLYLQYTDIGGQAFKSGMPSFGYRVRQR